MSTSAERITFTRALRIAGYNRWLYISAGIGVVAGVVLASLPLVPTPIRWLGGLGAAVAAWLACASFGAFHWMFDRSELLGGQWLREELRQVPQRWVQINAGLEETTLPLKAMFPDADGKMLDLYHPALMTELAVTQARQQGPAVAATTAKPDALPVEDGWADLVVVTLAAHEIRDVAKRERFFQELRRIGSPSGRLVVVEHLRNSVAALAFGPGVFHFLPRREWLRLGSLAGLEVERERRITPFVRVFVYHHAAPVTKPNA